MGRFPTSTNNSDTAVCPRIHSIVTLSTRREHQTLQGKSLVLPDFLPLPTPQHTHTHFRYQSQAQAGTCASISPRFPQTLSSGAVNLQEGLPELREMFYRIHHQFITKGYSSRTVRWERCIGWGMWHRASMTTLLSPHLHKFTNLGALQSLSFWVFMGGFITKAWLTKYWPWQLNSISSPIPLLEVCGWDWKFQLSNLMVIIGITGLHWKPAPSLGAFQKSPY